MRTITKFGKLLCFLNLHQWHNTTPNNNATIITCCKRCGRRLYIYGLDTQDVNGEL